MKVPFHAVANDLRGFGENHSSMRVLVTEWRDGHAWVRTASLRSAGVPLTLRQEQIDLSTREDEVSWSVPVAGLVEFM